MFTFSGADVRTAWSGVNVGAPKECKGWIGVGQCHQPQRQNVKTKNQNYKAIVWAPPLSARRECDKLDLIGQGERRRKEVAMEVDAGIEERMVMIHFRSAAKGQTIRKYPKYKFTSAH